jgi:hypothetical protein
MRIAVIGGVERTQTTLERLAADLGHELEFHPGHINGRGVEEIRRAVGRADLVVVLTDVNSHGAVKVARVACQKLGREMVLTKRLGTRELVRRLSPSVAA